MGLSIKRIVIGIAALLAVAWVLTGAAAYFGQRSLLFVPSPAHREPQVPGGTVVHLDANTVALWIPPPEAGCTVVHFHGNAQQLADLDRLAASLHAGGLGFFAVEYPGYGLAAGAPSEASIDEAAVTAVRYLHDVLHVPVDRTVLEGWSLGTGVAAELASRQLGSELILIAPFTSITAMGARMFPNHPVSLLVRDPFDTASKAPRIGLPTLIVHGSADSVIPVAEGEHLGRLFPNVTTVIEPGADHDVLMRESALARVIAFARQCPGAREDASPGR
jgi:pimeloyl-ACP methyl ester carboxylesterase